jgi:ABC-type transport system, involved in lipoprotein release, permease component
VILAATPEQVGAVSELSLSMADVDDPAALKLKTSEQLALLRAAVDSDLGSFGHQIVVGSVLVTAATVSTLLIGLVLMRRRDYGRRRALGASKRFIVMLITGQSLLTAVGGAICGEAIATVALEISGSPVPPFSFSVAVWVLLVSTASAASFPPALVAASREPVDGTPRALRV